MGNEAQYLRENRTSFAHSRQVKLCAKSCTQKWTDHLNLFLAGNQTYGQLINSVNYGDSKNVDRRIFLLRFSLPVIPPFFDYVHRSDSLLFNAKSRILIFLNFISILKSVYALSNGVLTTLKDQTVLSRDDMKIFSHNLCNANF